MFYYKFELTEAEGNYVEMEFLRSENYHFSLRYFTLCFIMYS